MFTLFALSRMAKLESIGSDCSFGDHTRPIMNLPAVSGGVS